jgi:hypothetical protein
MLTRSVFCGKSSQKIRMRLPLSPLHFACLREPQRYGHCNQDGSPTKGATTMEAIKQSENNSKDEVRDASVQISAGKGHKKQNALEVALNTRWNLNGKAITSTISNAVFAENAKASNHEPLHSAPVRRIREAANVLPVRRGLPVCSGTDCDSEEGNADMVAEEPPSPASSCVQGLATASFGVRRLPSDPTVWVYIMTKTGRPKKAESMTNAERQAAWRKQRITINTGERMTATIEGLAKDFDLTRDEVTRKLLRFALCSRPCKMPEMLVNRRFAVETHPKKSLRN